MKSHPNATVSLFSGAGLGNLIVWALNHWHLFNGISEYYKYAVVGAVSSAVLFLGRNGIMGTFRFIENRVLHGTGGTVAVK